MAYFPDFHTAGGPVPGSLSSGFQRAFLEPQPDRPVGAMVTMLALLPSNRSDFLIRLAEEQSKRVCPRSADWEKL
jgi:hypothetical protein